MHIVIENKSKLLDDAHGFLVTESIKTLLPTFCSDWNVKVPELSYLTRTRMEFFHAPQAVFVTITDMKQTGSHPAFHSILSRKPYGTIFAKSIVEMNTPEITISKFICHEIFEILVNPTLERNIFGFEAEVCDPVQLNTVMVNGIQLSDWVLPSWFQPNSKRPYNHTDTLLQPRTIDKGGYIYGR